MKTDTATTNQWVLIIIIIMNRLKICVTAVACMTGALWAKRGERELEEADRADDSFVSSFREYRLWTVADRLNIYILRIEFVGS